MPFSVHDRTARKARRLTKDQIIDTAGKQAISAGLRALRIGTVRATDFVDQRHLGLESHMHGFLLALRCIRGWKDSDVDVKRLEATTRQAFPGYPSRGKEYRWKRLMRGLGWPTYSVNHHAQVGVGR